MFKLLPLLFLLVACGPSPKPQAEAPVDSGCTIRGTLLRDTLIDKNVDSLIIITGVGMSLRLKHAVDYHPQVLLPGDVLFIKCHPEGHRSRGMTFVDTLVDSLRIIFPSPAKIDTTRRNTRRS